MQLQDPLVFGPRRHPCLPALDSCSFRGFPFPERLINIAAVTRSSNPSEPPARVPPRHERVGTGEDGQRIDNFLIRRAPGVPKSHVYRLIRTGDVRVDGKRVKQTRRLRVGEQVRIPALSVVERSTARVPDRLADELAASIVFEHDDFLALAKPPGIAVHGGTGLAFGAIDALRQALDRPSLELVHRLDRGTSGCLLVARDNATNRELQDLFRQRTVCKRYQALVAGRWPDGIEVVDEPLAKNVEHAGERRVVIDAAGQSALSRFAIVEQLDEATLLDVSIETGRTHQIRVHARHTGHAVIGDSRYGDNATNARFRRRGLSRLFLHSAHLGFDWRGQRIAIDVPPDAAWERALVTLREGADR